MKPHFLSSLIYVLLVILIIPGITPHVASAADNTDGDSGGSTYDSFDDFISDLVDGSNNDGSNDDGSNDDGSNDDGSNDDGSNDDGSNDDGSNDDGSNDDGSNDDGSNDDGSNDDGSNDDGSNDDGSNDDGSNDDGSNDDGSNDDGSNDDGSTTEDPADESGEKNNAESESSSSSSGSNSDSSSGSNSGSSSDSDDSGPSSMGSGISTEPATNIAVKELATRNVISGYHIKYEFLENVTCITHIEYDAKRTFRKTVTTVEVLKDRSTLVPMLPPGEIYKHVNIWVGENAAGLPTSIKNGLVGFRVEKEWIENNNVSESLVTLQWYDKGWKPLDTERIGEDEKYVYFESETPGYSMFAITEYNAEEETQLQKTLRTLTGSKEDGMAEEPMKMAKMFLAIALPLFMVIAGYAVLKKKI